MSNRKTIIAQTVEKSHTGVFSARPFTVFLRMDQCVKNKRVVRIKTFSKSNDSRIIKPSGFRNNIDSIIDLAVLNSRALKNTQVKLIQVKVKKA